MVVNSLFLAYQTEGGGERLIANSLKTRLSLTGYVPGITIYQSD